MGIDLSGNNPLHRRIAKLLASGKQVRSWCIGMVGEVTKVDDLFATLKPKRAGKNGKTRYACQFVPGKHVLMFVQGHGWRVRDSAKLFRRAFGA